MAATKLFENWRKVAVNAAVRSALRAAGSAPTQGGGAG
jgi:hypothetical protein